MMFPLISHSPTLIAQIEGVNPLLFLVLLTVLAVMVGWVIFWNHVLHRRVEEKSERLLASEAFLERLFRQSPHGMWVADRDGTLLMMNDACEDLFGIEHPEQIIGNYNVFRDNVVQELNLREEIERAFRGETVTLTDHYDPGRLEGFSIPSKKLYLRTTFSPILTLSGDVNHVLVMHEDITSSNLVEAELRIRNRKVHALMEAFSNLTTTLDPSEIFASVPELALKALPGSSFGGLFLYDPEQDVLVLEHSIGFEKGDNPVQIPRGVGMVGRAFQDGKLLLLPDEESVREIQSSLPAPSLEIWNRVSGKWSHPPQAALSIPLEARNRFIGVLAVVTCRPEAAFTQFDARQLEAFADHAATAIDNAFLYEALSRNSSELEGVNRRLRAALEELKLLDEMKTNLLSNVSHELRTPLIAILGYTDLMLKGRLGPLTEDQRNRLEICMKNAERLSKRIEDLLNFSRTEMGEMQLEISRFDLNEVLIEAVESLQTHATENGIQITTDLTGDEILVRGDREKILQVFSNLLDNAVKFNKKGGTILVDSKAIAKGMARVNITDSGIGIPEEALERIFDRFYQVDASLSRSYGGTGIGLSLVRSIVDIHGGRVRVQSTSGQGSTFTVVLPVYDSTRDSGRFSEKDLERAREAAG